MHYDRHRKTGSLDIKTKQRTIQFKECSVDGCDLQSNCKTLCVMHYARLQRNGEVGPAGKMNDGKYGENLDGYRRIIVNGKRVLEHRVIMENLIGRKLTRNENVHHKNGDRADNRPENLELWSSSQPPGQRIEDKVEWAIEILNLYKPEALRDKI